MDYKKLAQLIVESVGGKGNISSVTHCATRLRFTLHNGDKFDEEKLKAINGVMGTVVAGGQHQVIVGQDVANIYNEVTPLLDGKMTADTVEESKSLFARVLDTISGIFTPILPAIVGASMIKVLIILLTMFNLLSETSQTYTVLTFVGDTAFYFLPIMLAYSAAVKFKMNPMLGMMLGLMMIHPTYMSMVEAGESVTIFGFIPMTLAKYTSTVIPIILVVWVASYIERFMDKVVPNAIKFFIKPFLTLLIMIPIAFCVIGPLGTIVGQGLESVLNVIQTQAPWSLPIIFGVAAPIVIMFGMHYVVTIPLVMTAIAANGFDMLGAGFLVANVAQGAAALAVSLLAKDTDFKAMAASTGVSALLGVTEPAMYGVNLKLKKPFFAALAGGLTGGLICGIAGVKRIVFGPTGLTTIAIFVDPDNNMNFIFAIIGVVAAFVVAFGLTYMLVKKDNKMIEEI